MTTMITRNQANSALNNVASSNDAPPDPSSSDAPSDPSSSTIPKQTDAPSDPSYSTIPKQTDPPFTPQKVIFKTENFNILEPPTPTTTPRIILRTPTPFNGTTSEYHEFLFAMENEFISNLQYYPNDQSMISYCCSYLTGPALKHFRTQSQANPLVRSDWTAFIGILSLFQPYNENDQALAALKALRQVASAREYVDSFLPLATSLLTTYPTSYIIGLFTGGLSLKISDALLAFPASQELITICQRAIIIDDQMKSNRDERNRRFPATTQPTNRFLSQRPQYQPQFAQTTREPPQQSITSRPSGPPGQTLPTLPRRVAGPLTAEERAHRVTHNLCIICASSSHHRNECPRNRNRQQLNSMSASEITNSPREPLQRSQPNPPQAPVVPSLSMQPSDMPNPQTAIIPTSDPASYWYGAPPNAQHFH